MRLGLANSAGTQELIVHVIAKGRQELANLKNVTIPGNAFLSPKIEPELGSWYADLVARALKKSPGAAITEFAWQGALPPPKPALTAPFESVVLTDVPELGLEGQGPKPAKE